MRIVNVEMGTAAYPADECERLVRFAGEGLPGGSVRVVVRGRPYGITGKAPGRRDGSVPRVEIRLGAKSTVRCPIVPTAPSLKERLPSVRCRDWRDAFIWVVAHELRHVWQLDSPPCCRSCSEEDAEVWALRSLNRWRRSAGRLAVPM